MTGVVGPIYRGAAAVAAEIAFRVPALERPLLRIGVPLWRRKYAGRFYRSAVGRYVERLRGAGRQYRRLLVGGVPLVLDVTEFTTSTLFFGDEAYEPATTEYLRNRLTPGSVFVDVGANHGYFTMLGAAIVGARGRVLAFEPNPPVFEQLTTHVRLNGFTDRVALFRTALGDRVVESAPFFIPAWIGNSGVATLTPDERPIAEGLLARDKRITVAVDTLDRTLAAASVDRIDLVKIDVEGAEALVVGGMRRSLAAGRIAAIVCETVWDSPADRALRDAGFSARPLEACGPGANIAYERG